LLWADGDSHDVLFAVTRLDHVSPRATNRELGGVLPTVVYAAGIGWH